MVKTVDELNAEIDAQFTDNHSRSITPAKQRTVLKDIVTNIPVTSGQVLTDSGTPNSATYLRGDNTWNTPSGGGGSGNPVFATYADARAAITAGIDASVKSFWTSGFHAPADNGNSLYVDVGSVDKIDDPALFSYPNSALIVGEPAYIHDTINNRYFLMMPKGGEVWVEQFGATAPGYQTRGSNLTDYLYKAQRYCIKTWKTDTVRIGPGFWYQATTFNVKGISLRVRGTGHLTFVQPDVGVTGMCGCYQYTFNGFGLNGWGPSVSYNIWTVSDGTTRAPYLSTSGNVYELITAGTSASSGGGPTGTGTNITDGTAHWKYIRPVLPDEDFNSVDAGGAIFEDMQFYSLWNRSTDQYGLACGIINNAHSVTFRNITADNMSAHGLAHIANGDPSFPNASGNCDGWRIENCTCYYNGWSGVRVGYSIGNAGHGIGLDVSSNGWYGVDDNTFLLATWVDVQSAFDGRPSFGVKKYAGQVEHNGRWYTARVQVSGIEGNANYHEEPGTGSWWILDFGDGTVPPETDHPSWNSTTIYEPGGGYVGHDFNSRSVWNGVYIEQGTMPSQFGVNHTVLGILAPGGSLVHPTRGLILSDATWLGGRNAISIRNGSSQNDGTFKEAAAQFGPNSSGIDKGIFRYQDWDANGLTWVGESSDGYTHLHYPLKNGSATIWDLLGANSGKTFGGSTAIANILQLPQFVLGDDTNGIVWGVGTAAPTSGYWVQGSKITNKNYTAGGVSDWVCTVSGTPGTWVGLKPAN